MLRGEQRRDHPLGHRGVARAARVAEGGPRRDAGLDPVGARRERLHDPRGPQPGQRLEHLGVVADDEELGLLVRRREHGHVDARGRGGGTVGAARAVMAAITARILPDRAPATPRSRNDGSSAGVPTVMVPAAQAAALERLADSVDARGATLPTRRMLLIVNPYATTMSGRLEKLVVYALQGRYEVEAVDTQRPNHATELCREAVARGLRRRGRLRRRRHGQRGRERARRHAHRAVLLPGGSTNVVLPHARHPRPTWSTPPSTCSRLADDWSRAASTSAASTAAASSSPAARASTPSVVERVDAPPAAEGAARRRGTSPSAARAASSRHYVVDPPRLGVEAGGRERRRRQRVRPERAALHVLQPPPDRALPRAWRSTRATSPASCCAAPTRSTCRRSPTACSPQRAGRPSHRQVDELRRPRRARVRSADERPVPRPGRRRLHRRASTEAASPDAAPARCASIA